jgi:hypothetical protein
VLSDRVGRKLGEADGFSGDLECPSCRLASGALLRKLRIEADFFGSC